MSSTMWHSPGACHQVACSTIVPCARPVAKHPVHIYHRCKVDWPSFLYCAHPLQTV